MSQRLVGRSFVAAAVHHPRVARRHPPGGRDLCERLEGRRCLSVERRGKYLWLPVDDGAEALVAHLGMSGQFRFSDRPMREHPHLRFDARLDDGYWLSFLDQRTFGGMSLDHLGPAPDGRLVPVSLLHIAVDPYEPAFDLDQVVRRVRRRRSEIKRILLDQTVVSGIGNIYADEALWRARVHPERLADRLSAPVARDVLTQARTVMAEALDQGGTSFDALYVNVNGESGYFERSLAVYGREAEACLRCGTGIRRLQFANRSSFICPLCQRAPRARGGPRAPIG